MDQLLLSQADSPSIHAIHLYRVLEHIIDKFRREKENDNDDGDGEYSNIRHLANLSEIEVIESLYTSNTNLQSKILALAKVSVVKYLNKKYSHRGLIIWNIIKESMFDYTMPKLIDHYDYFYLKHSLIHYNKLVEVNNPESYLVFSTMVKPWKHLSSKISNDLDADIDSDNTSITTTINSIKRKLEPVVKRLSQIVDSVDKSVGDIFGEYNKMKVPIGCKELLDMNKNNYILYTDTYNMVLKITWVTILNVLEVSLFDTTTLRLLDSREMPKDQVIEILDIIFIEDNTKRHTLNNLEDFFNIEIDNIVIDHLVDKVYRRSGKYMEDLFKDIVDKIFSSGSSLPYTNLCMVQLVLGQLNRFIHVKDKYILLRFWGHPRSMLTTISENPLMDNAYLDKETKLMDQTTTSKLNEIRHSKRKTFNIPPSIIPTTSPEQTYSQYILHLWANVITRKLDNDQIVFIKRLHNSDISDTVSHMNQLFSLNIITSTELDKPMSNPFSLERGSFGSILIEINIKDGDITGFTLYYVSGPETGKTKARAVYLSTANSYEPLERRENAYIKMKSVMPVNQEFEDATKYIKSFIFPGDGYKTWVAGFFIRESPDRVFLRFIKLMWILELMIYGVIDFSSGSKRNDIDKYAIDILNLNHETLLKYYIERLNTSKSE